MDADLPPLDLDRGYGIAPISGERMSRDEYVAWLDANLWKPSPVAGLEVPQDTSAAEWIGEAITPGGFEVRMTVPECFEAYARIFFPIVGADISSEGRVIDNERISWTEVAARNNKSAHAVMEAETIGADRDRLYNCFSEDQETALWPILERHTASASGWFLLWEGFGGLDPRPFAPQPKVEHPGRAYHLMHGPLTARDTIMNAPSYIWPDDRTWCLVRDIDFYWAYIAGTQACIEEIIATPILDAFATMPSNPARSGMDTLNDPEGTTPRLA